MTEEQKQAYTRRITQSNKTQLVTILYEMTTDYMNDARAAITAQKKAETDEQILRAQRCVDQLISGLDMKYELSLHLLQLYLFTKRELVRAVLDHDPKHFDNADIVIGGMHKAYLELEKLDTDKPEIENAQTVVAGMTYGLNGLNEAVTNSGANRGFTA